MLRQKSGSHSIALGFSLGFIPNLFPTFGLGPFISVAIARIVRVNTISALLGGTIGTWLWPVLFYVNYLVGEAIVNPDVQLDKMDDSIQHIAEGMEGIGVAFLIGAGINSAVISVVLYFIAFSLMSRYRYRILQWVTHLKDE